MSYERIPARMLNEVVCCPWPFCLEHVAREWEESADTVSGKRVHRRVGGEALPLPEPGALPEDLKGRRSRFRVRRKASPPKSKPPTVS
jgi:hypothetical protein